MALIETIRVRQGTAPLWGLHLGRLARSCQALGVPFPGELAVPAGGLDRVHRLEVGPRGVTVTEREVGAAGPVRLVLGRAHHRPYPHKTTERGQFDHALAEARAAGADDALLLTPGGWVAEAAIWAVLWWEGDRLAGPPLEFGILPSVGRSRAAEIAGPIIETRATPADLAGRALVVVNAVRGVVPVAALAGRPMPNDPRTEALIAQFWG